MADLGKTTLVRSWAGRFGRFYPDVQIYVDFAELRDEGNADVNDALRSEVAKMEGGCERLRNLSPSEAKARYRNCRHGRRALVMLEDVMDPSGIEAFRPVTPHSLLLATSAFAQVEMGGGQVSLATAGQSSSMSDTFPIGMPVSF